jgi:hypothetical protein
MWFRKDLELPRSNVLHAHSAVSGLRRRWDQSTGSVPPTAETLRRVVHRPLVQIA